MEPARIAELLRPFLEARTEARPKATPRAAQLPAHYHSEPTPPGDKSIFLSPDQLQHISTYIDILIRWNARINLTAIRDPEEIVTRHFGESLFAARHLFPRNAPVETAALGCPAEQSSASTDQSAPATRARAALQVREEDPDGKGALAPGANDERPTTNDRLWVADIGTGAGFPGIPIKLWAPEISLTLIESNQKKATFLREVTRALTLTDVNIQNVRAESLASRSFNVVTLRAVERFDQILPVAANLALPAGRLALLIGAAQLDQARSILPDFEWSAPQPVPVSRARVLLQARRTG